MADHEMDLVSRALDAEGLPPSFDVLFRETREAVLRQQESSDRLDTKAGAMVAVAGAVVVGLLAILAEGAIFTHVENVLARLIVTIQLLAGIGFVLVSLASAPVAIGVRRHPDLLEPRRSCARYLAREPEVTSKQMLCNWLLSHEGNKQIAKRKGALLHIAVGALALGVLTFAGAVAVYLLVLTVAT